MALPFRHIRFIAATLLAIWFAQHTFAQATSAEHFPYAFSNFAWWSDTDLRTELKRRIPALGNELTRNSAAEAKVRTTLVELLKAKGIDANVQVHEPDADYASQKRVPEAPPVAIVFSVASPPYIAIDKFVFDGAPFDVADALKSAVEVRNMYSSQNLWWMEDRFREVLEERGYLTPKVTINPETPVRDRDNFKVSLTAHILPGPKFHVATIKGNGGPLLAGRDLSPYFTLKSGDVARPNPFGRLAGSVRSVYWQAGYPNVEMSGEPKLDTEHGLASYDFEVVPGPLYHLRSLQILHLDEAQQAQVNSILKMKQGDTYDGMATSRLSQTLRSPSSLLNGYDFTYTPKEDEAAHVVDLTLDFYKKQ